MKWRRTRFLCIDEWMKINTWQKYIKPSTCHMCTDFFLYRNSFQECGFDNTNFSIDATTKCACKYTDLRAWDNVTGNLHVYERMHIIMPLIRTYHFMCSVRVDEWVKHKQRGLVEECFQNAESSSSLKSKPFHSLLNLNFKSISSTQQTNVLYVSVAMFQLKLSSIFRLKHEHFSWGSLN